MVSEPYGAKTKRQGYSTYLGTPDTSQVNSLFSWTKNDGTTLFVYRASGTLLYYSLQGTGAWTIAGNGTISSGAHVGYTVLDNTLILGDGVGSTRHTTSGTSFTNTTLAPVGEFFENYQNRVYIAGTSSTLFYSTTNDATNWNTSGTSDSNSIQIPGAGKLDRIFKANDRLVTTKNSGLMHRWDGSSLVDMSTDQGPSSPYSVDQKEGFFFWLNRDGYQGYGGVKPQLISNNIQPQVFNNTGSAITGTTFNTAPSVVHRYDYLTSVGTVTDDFTNETVNNCVQVYNFQKNEWFDWSLGTMPTAWHSFKNASGDQQLIFGDASGQCYQAGGVNTDNGAAIPCSMELIVDMKQPETDKLWRWITVFTNPGCEAKVQVAIGDSYKRDALNWVEIDNVSSGAAQLRFNTTGVNSARGKLLFIRIYESSKDKPFTLYGFSIEAEFEEGK